MIQMAGSYVLWLLCWAFYLLLAVSHYDVKWDWNIER